MNNIHNNNQIKYLNYQLHSKRSTVDITNIFIQIIDNFVISMITSISESKQHNYNSVSVNKRVRI